MKKVVVASDSFKGSVTSWEVAESVEIAVHRVFPTCEVVKIPVGDGGEGTVETLIAAMNGTTVTTTVHDPLMRPIEVAYGILEDGNTAVMEMAAASGLPLLTESERNPLETTTYGTGEMIKDALRKGCRNFLIGIGGSATNDAGVGMLQALGFRFLNQQGKAVGLGGKVLGEIEAVDTSNLLPELLESTFSIACDVNNPFYGEKGAAHVFARQKGADDSAVQALDKGLRHFAQIMKRFAKIEIAELPGAGAAGGLGGGFVAFLQAQLKPGIQQVLEAVRFEERIQGADLVITGEGKLDKQTCMGKTPFGVLQVASKQQIPVIVMGGSVEEVAVLNQKGFLAVLPLLPYPVQLERAMEKTFTRQNIVRTIEQQMRVIQYMQHIQKKIEEKS